MQNEQLDRLAAKHVMRWEWICGFDATMAPAVYISTKEGATPNHDPLPESEWSPTTNEQHAAMVREKMRSDGWMLRLWAHPNFHEAEWIFQADRSRIGQSGAGTPSVCYAQIKAALLAVEAITEEDVNL